ncbi:MAG0770 family lipoprotein [Mycoplasma sp. Ms02]|uniref:MAG0770 family lipoprotein n=1 Tax=Mycoplasma sp. Ms02 TaxID=353851 RepID=UPI001C8B0437|nr:hypothetical protein [Mycoplasma sp. Ms02]QZE12402.1 hypothetical protein K4L35_00200 [Mycoplasma sp. Ms02]
MLKRIKKISLIFASLSVIPFISASCGSTFDNRIQSEDDKKLSEIKINISKIEKGKKDFDKFINNQSSLKTENIDYFYKEINAKALDLSQKLYSLIEKIQENDNAVIDEIRNRFFVSSSSDSILDYLEKMSFINKDISKLLKERKDQWINDNKYLEVINILKSYSQSLDAMRDIKKGLLIDIDQVINASETSNSSVYVKRWFDESLKTVNYDLIANYLSDNNESSTQTYQEQLKTHTHALGNIVREWMLVTVQAEEGSQSINTRQKIQEMIEELKANSKFTEALNSTPEIKQIFDEVVASLENLNQSISEITKINSNQYPYKKFLNFLIDKDNDTYTSTSFGLMNSGLKNIYLLIKSL